MRRALLAVGGGLALGLVTWGCGPALTVLGVVGLDALDDDSERASNAAPAVSVVTPAGTVNDTIPITYVITDPDALDRASVTVDYATGSGSFQPATQAFADGAEGTQNLSTSPAGASHVFLWSSAADLGWNDVPSVRVRVSVTDASAAGLAGAPATTAPFAVKNRFITTLARAPVPPGVSPLGLAVTDGDDLIIADGGGHRVVRVAGQDGQVSVLAGTGEPGNAGSNLLGPSAQLNLPVAVAEAGGEIFVADSFNGLLRRIDTTTGFLSDVAGAGDVSDDDYASTGVLARDASLAPRDVAVDDAGNPYVLSLDAGRVRALNTRSALALPFPTNPVSASLGPGRIMSILAGNLLSSATAGLPPAFVAPSLVDAVALAVWDDGSTRLVYSLELGPQGGDRAALGVANFDDASLDFETPTGTVTVGPGEFELLSSDLPTLRDFADLALVAPQVVLLASGGDGAVYAANLSPATVIVAGTTLAPGGREVVIGKANAPGLSSDGGDPLDARLIGPFGVAVDEDENIFLSEANGRVRVVAGPGGDYVLGDLRVERGKVGTVALVLPGTQASVVQPTLVTLGRGGDLLVTDSDLADPRSNRVLRVRGTDATVEGLAGNGVFGDSGDGGPAAATRLGLALCAAQDPLRDLVVFSDFIHARVRAVNVGATPTTFLGVTIAPGEVDTVVGTGAQTSSPAAIDDGVATTVTLRFPSLLAFDAQGLLWVSDTGDNVIRVANPTGSPVTVLGRTIAPNHLVTVVGTSDQGTPADDGDGGPAPSAKLSAPAAVLGADGNLWILDGLRSLQAGLEDPGNNGPGQGVGNDEARVRVVNLQTSTITVAGVAIAPGEVETVIGAATPRLPNNSNLGDGGPALDATFREPSGLSVRSDGLVFISDSDDDRIRIINTTSTTRTIGGRTLGPGIIDTIVGGGVPGYTGDPSAVAEDYFGVTQPEAGLLDGPSGVLALDDGRLLFADSRNGALRMANLADAPRRFAGIEAAPGGLVVIAGSRSGRVRARTPVDVEVTDGGAVLFSDLGRFNTEPAVLRIDPETRVVTRAVGTQERTSFDGSNLGDGGPALLATLAEPIAIDLGSDGSLYIADAGNRRIRFVNRGTSTTSPTPGLSVRAGDIDTLVDGGNDALDLVPDDGQSIAQPTSLTLLFPSSVARGGSSTLWIGDEGSDRVLRVNLSTGLVEGVLDDLVVQASRPCTVDVDASTGFGRLTDAGGFVVTLFTGDTLRFGGIARTTVVTVLGPTELLFTPAPNGPINTTYEVLRTGRPTALVAIDDAQAYAATGIDDLGGSRIMHLTWTGSAFTAVPIAGTGAGDWNGDLLAALSMNLGLVRGLHRDGDLLLVGDGSNHRLVAVNVGLSPITVAGLSIDPGNARTIAGAGQGRPGFNGDAVPAAAALLNQPSGVSLSPDGGIVFVDAGNARVRRFQR